VSSTAIDPSSTTDPPKIIETKPVISNPTSVPANGEISYTMSVLLEKYDMLDDDNKNELLKYVISSGNENLQSRLLMLQQNKVGTSLAKLTKELIKLADSYKVPELKFDEQAGKRRFNYQAWLTKL
jgi:hypothetical protein